MTTPENDRIDALTHILGNCPGMCNYPDCWFQKHSKLIDDGSGDFDKVQQQAIEQLLIEARIDEVKNLPRAGFIGSGGIRYEATLFTQMDNRITELKNQLKECK